MRISEKFKKYQAKSAQETQFQDMQTKCIPKVYVHLIYDVDFGYKYVCVGATDNIALFVIGPCTINYPRFKCL